jgi:hypothetical protein
MEASAAETQKYLSYYHHHEYKYGMQAKCSAWNFGELFMMIVFLCGLLGSWSRQSQFLSKDSYSTEERYLLAREKILYIFNFLVPVPYFRSPQHQEI